MFPFLPTGLQALPVRGKKGLPTLFARTVNDVPPDQPADWIYLQEPFGNFGSKIYLRPEALSLMEVMKESKLGGVITGNPGIGKSFMIAAELIRCEVLTKVALIPHGLTLCDSGGLAHSGLKREWVQAQWLHFFN